MGRPVVLFALLLAACAAPPPPPRPAPPPPPRAAPPPRPVVIRGPRGIRIQARPAATWAVLAVQGFPYAELPAHLKALAREAARQGLTPLGPPGARYPGDPRAVPLAAYPYEVGVAVAPGTAPARPLKLRRLPAGLWAGVTWRGDHDEAFHVFTRETVPRLLAGMGYRLRAPPVEVYRRREGPPRLWITEVRYPVEKVP